MFRHISRIRILLFLTMLFPVFSCAGESIVSYDYEVVNTYAHDKTAYTQGLFVENGYLYESCGQYGMSSFRKYDIASGKIMDEVSFGREYFAEGSCCLDGIVYILTWMEETCFVYDLATMSQVGSLPYAGEGWGLATDGSQLIMSDGTSSLRFLDPLTFAVRKTVEVTMDGKPLRFINELEYIGGMIWANVYLSDIVVMINPKTGKVEGKIDFSRLYPYSERHDKADVLNGIAYDRDTGKIYVTGKLWPSIYEIEIL